MLRARPPEVFELADVEGAARKKSRPTPPEEQSPRALAADDPLSLKERYAAARYDVEPRSEAPMSGGNHSIHSWSLLGSCTCKS